MQVLGAGAAALDPSQTNPPAGATSTGVPGIANETTFLHLLVAQIQNQDPLNPTDSVQFVGQLVQFSQLEQLLGINSGVQDLLAKTPAPTPPSTPPAGGTNNSIQQ